MFPNIDKAPPYGLGQPVYFNPNEFTTVDHTCFVIHGFQRGILGNWMAKVIPEGGSEMDMRCVPCKYLTDQPPAITQLHPSHMGRVYLTSTMRPLKAIDGGFHEFT